MTAPTPLFKELDTVVLVRDVPESGLRAGDLGAVVQVYSPEAFEVEFVKAAGGTQALLTLGAQDLRAVRDDDLLAVRSAEAARGAA
jgi:Domain of unknown function (DUF4926)